MAPWLEGPARRADALFLNEEEARALTGRDGEATAPALSGEETVVLTLGAWGAPLASRLRVETVPAAPARAVDPTGAGDALMAAAPAHAAPRGWRPDAAAVAAGVRAAGVRAAALTVGREGVFAALPTREELAAILPG